jgi:hypothetical protein
MTEERLALSELLEKSGEGDFLRAVAEAVLQLLMEADVEGLIGTARYERSGVIDEVSMGRAADRRQQDRLAAVRSPEVFTYSLDSHEIAECIAISSCSPRALQLWP